MKELKELQRNTTQKEATKLFLIDALKQIAVERAFVGESVVGIKEAKEAIDIAFERLDTEYAKVE